MSVPSSPVNDPPDPFDRGAVKGAGGGGGGATIKLDPDQKRSSSELAVSLFANEPAKQAWANNGTIENKKVFVSDSSLAGAGKGLFAGETIGPGEVISFFTGDIVYEHNAAQQSHLITLVAMQSTWMDCG
eukprot:SAG31_NODE_6002_length_2218_cov_1.772534_2_plen_130_part_00